MGEGALVLFHDFMKAVLHCAEPMASAFHNPEKRIRLSLPVLASVMCLLTSACATAPFKVVETILVDSPRGAVFLQGVEDRWFQAAHPLSVSPELLAHVFRGVQVQALPADKTPAVRVFSNEDTEFLSPLMSAALSKATKGQLVGFRVLHGTDAGSETTGGFLYAQGRLLHLTLTHYRANAGRRETGAHSELQLVNPTALGQSQIGFIPQAARRSSLNEQPGLVDTSPLATLAIDYELLAPGSGPQSAPVQSQPLHPDDIAVTHQNTQPILPADGVATSLETQAAHSEEIRSVKELVIKKAAELDALKEEVRTLQRRLAEIDAETQKTKKQKSASPQRKSVP